jgi:hypothetical protein
MREQDKTGATAVPWNLFEHETGWYINQQGGPGFIGNVFRAEHRAAECEANARLIVQAVNSHAALVAALQDALDWLDDGNRVLSDACRADVEAAYVVLAKAKESK